MYVVIFTRNTNHKSTNNKNCLGKGYIPELNRIPAVLKQMFSCMGSTLVWYQQPHAGICQSWPLRCWNTWRASFRRGGEAWEIHMTQGIHLIFHISFFDPYDPRYESYLLTHFSSFHIFGLRDPYDPRYPSHLTTYFISWYLCTSDKGFRQCNLIIY